MFGFFFIFVDWNIVIVNERLIRCALDQESFNCIPSITLVMVEEMGIVCEEV